MIKGLVSELAMHGVEMSPLGIIRYPIVVRGVRIAICDREDEANAFCNMMNESYYAALELEV